MAISFNSKGVASMKFNGKNVSEAWLNGSKVWPNATSIEPLISDISRDLNIMPIHFSEFNGDLEQPLITLQTSFGRPRPWASEPSNPTFGPGCCGRKALYFGGSQSSVIQLHSAAKVKDLITISALVRTNTLSTYGGFIGGTIFGLVTQGFGYAIGWGRNIQNNKICAEVYSDGNVAAACYSNTAMNPSRWYHIMAKCCVNYLISGSVYACTNVNGEGWKRASTYPGENIDYSNTDAIYLGRVLQSGTNYLTGFIQDFVLWPIDVPEAQLARIIQYYQENGVY